jgi:hypothetical protein
VAVGEHALEDSGSEPPYLTTFRYEYHALTSSKAGAEPFAVAILGPIVTLTVENARGQTDSVTHVVPAAYPIVTFAGANTFGFPRCPHVQDHVTNVASLAADVGLTLAGNDTVGVPLDCAKTSKLCGGLVTLSTATGRGGVSARAARAMARAIVVGQERFALTPGRHATIKVALNQRGRALARQGRLRKMRVTVTTLHFGKGEGKSVSVVLAIKREAGPRVKRRGRP